MEPPAMMFGSDPPHAWYQGGLDAMMQRGAGSDATREEVVRLVLEPNEPRAPQAFRAYAFDDVPTVSHLAAHFERARTKKWIKGDRNCAGVRHPCHVRPTATMNRAEASAFFVRAFALPTTGVAPALADLPKNAWYTGYMQTMADHCALPNDTDMMAHPSWPVTHAEISRMFEHAIVNAHYGVDCSA